MSCNLDGTGWPLEAEHLTTNNKIDDYTVHPDGSLTLHFVERYITECRGAHTEHRGPSAAFLEDGWHLLPDSSMPEFGFHELPD